MNQPSPTYATKFTVQYPVANCGLCFGLDMGVRALHTSDTPKLMTIGLNATGNPLAAAINVHVSAAATYAACAFPDLRTDAAASDPFQSCH